VGMSQHVAGFHQVQQQGGASPFIVQRVDNGAGIQKERGHVNGGLLFRTAGRIPGAAF
jgi:hypothetical protein